MLPKDINIPLPKGIKIEGPRLFLTLEERAMTDHILNLGTDDGCLICDPGDSDEVIIEKHTQMALLRLAIKGTCDAKIQRQTIPLYAKRYG